MTTLLKLGALMLGLVGGLFGLPQAALADDGGGLNNLPIALPIGGALLLIATALLQKGRWFETALYSLVALNVFIYVAWGTVSQGIDSIGWFLLLTLFRLETANLPSLQAPWVKTAMHSVRFLCALLIVWACIGFWMNGEVLSGINSLFWIGLVIAIELLLRWESKTLAQAKMIHSGLIFVFGGLIVFALMWTFQAKWVEAYDAFLWILAFITIERGAYQLANRPGRTKS
jgi:hypothetical protein